MKNLLYSTLLSVLLVTPATFAQVGKRGHEGMKPPHMQIMKELDLSKEQREQLKSLRAEDKKDSAKHKIKELTHKLHRAAFKGDDEQIDSLIEELRASYKEAALKGKMFREVLTPEQLATFEQKMKQKKEAHMEQMSERHKGVKKGHFQKGKDRLPAFDTDG